MRRFKFSLEKVLQLRKFREEECKLALGQAISILNKIENDIKEIAQKRHNAAQSRFSNIADFVSWDNYILRLEQETEKLAEQAAKAEMTVEEKRALYLEAQKDFKVMENLKDKRQKEYRREMLNAQMNEIDDLTAARHSI
ncbi:MAG: flagellar export protein FliJ [Treponema sp.]|nr:flagellar export protein FliJ [Treponema sp.]